MALHDAASAANRFGLGARPGDLQAIGSDPRGWLLAQLQGDGGAAALASLPTGLDYLRREDDARRQLKQFRAQHAAEVAAAAATASPTMADAAPAKRPSDPYVQLVRDARQQELDARQRHALATADGFVERLVRFWSNHFAVSADKRIASLHAAPMEREAIRPHLSGDFGGLLLAVQSHPAMLRYLDNTRSAGDDSAMVRDLRRREAARDKPPRPAGLNENLAREILELHTLGVNGGYSQADVIELARAITGWSVPATREFERGGVDSEFLFRADAHEDGARTVLGRSYAAGGVEQGRKILTDLAVRPATARHVCTKLARHFVADAPPPALVERMARAWLREGGALLAVYRALVESPEAWGAQAYKFKTPDDYLLSAARAAGIADGKGRVQQLLVRLGQPSFMPRSPAGWPDTAADWAGSDALWKRLQAAGALADAVPAAQAAPAQCARQVLGDDVDAELTAALRGAGSQREGYALLFASPAFQWRS